MPGQACEWQLQCARCAARALRTAWSCPPGMHTCDCHRLNELSGRKVGHMQLREAFREQEVVVRWPRVLLVVLLAQFTLHNLLLILAVLCLQLV
jgi:hypothetical protein